MLSYCPDGMMYKPLFQVLHQVHSVQEARLGQGVHGHHQHREIPVYLAPPLVQQNQLIN